MIYAVVIGNDEKAHRVGTLIKKYYNNLARTVGEEELSIEYYVDLCPSESTVNSGEKKCFLSDVTELYKTGCIEAIIVPQGIYSYVIPILHMDGIPLEAVYCMEDSVLNAPDPSAIALDDFLKGFNEVGYLHPEVPYEADTKMRNLGKKQHTCAICGSSGEFESYLAREMMQNTRDEFEYFVCDNCFCLQIADVPNDLGKYYGENYYSFALPEDPDRKYSAPITNMDKILDVGCGSGVWLVRMAEKGFGNLHGVDPFLDHEVRHGDRAHIKNCSIHELKEDGTYDFIRFSDSFEHVTDPHEVLASACRLLKDDGVIRILIPTYPNIAFDIFGTAWYQLDAPRHIFLHSLKSMDYLAKKNGLRIHEISYESNCTQFYRSFMYAHNVPFFETDEKAKDYFLGNVKELEYISGEANKRYYGDHMTLTLVKQ